MHRSSCKDTVGLFVRDGFQRAAPFPSSRCEAGDEEDTRQTSSLSPVHRSPFASPSQPETSQVVFTSLDFPSGAVFYTTGTAHVCLQCFFLGREGGSFSCRRWRLTRRSVRMLRPLRPGLQVSACCWRVAVWFHHSYMLLVSCFPLAFCKFTLFRFHFQRVAQLDFALCETPHKTLRVTPFFFFLLTLH